MVVLAVSLSHSRDRVTQYGKPVGIRDLHLCLLKRFHRRLFLSSLWVSAGTRSSERPLCGAEFWRRRRAVRICRFLFCQVCNWCRPGTSSLHRDPHTHRQSSSQGPDLPGLRPRSPPTSPHGPLLSIPLPDPPARRLSASLIILSALGAFYFSSFVT